MEGLQKGDGWKGDGWKGYRRVMGGRVIEG